jgi:hypothetical protein
MYSPNRINLLSDQEIEAIYAIPECDVHLPT